MRERKEGEGGEEEERRKEKKQSKTCFLFLRSGLALVGKNDLFIRIFVFKGAIGGRAARVLDFLSVAFSLRTGAPAGSAPSLLPCTTPEPRTGVSLGEHTCSWEGMLRLRGVSASGGASPGGSHQEKGVFAGLEARILKQVSAGLGTLWKLTGRVPPASASSGGFQLSLVSLAMAASPPSLFVWPYKVPSP